MEEAEEEIHYKPISVRELLTEINNIVEFMTDLAYSAVLFNDVELAKEVVELDKQVDYLRTLLHMNMAMAVKSRRDAEAMTGIVRIVIAADRISGAARDIANTILLGLSIGEEVIRALSRTEGRLIRTKIVSESILSGKTLRQLELRSKIGIDIISIKRDEGLIINPKHGERLRVGDIIIARGSDVGILEFDRLAKGELKGIPESGVK